MENVPQGLTRFLIRRTAMALLLVVGVSSLALILAQLAPGDYFSGFEVDPATAAAERHRLGLDRPALVQYGTWLGRAVRLDLGESLKYQRPVGQLIAERAPNTAILGAVALSVATLLGLPVGMLTGSRRTVTAAALRGVSLVVVSTPPLVTSFALLVLASATGWFPVGGASSAGLQQQPEGAGATARYLVLPVIALALPIAAALERLQSAAMTDALSEPCVLAALARGCSRERIVWRHALRLSLKPVLAVYGAVVGAVLSGSFVVEVVMSWPGLGALMYEALVGRDLFLVAGCAAAGAAFLAAGVLASDLALAFVDPRLEDA